MAFANKYKFCEEEFENIIFSDEKNFKLGGPDGHHTEKLDGLHDKQATASLYS